LETCRPNFALSPIPFTAIAEFSNLLKIDDFEEFLYIIRCMDRAYLEVKGKKQNGPKTSPRDNNQSRRKGLK
jgi:hypothetical protein